MRLISLIIVSAFVAFLAGCGTFQHRVANPTFASSSTTQVTPTSMETETTVVTLSDFEICLQQEKGNPEAKRLCVAESRKRRAAHDYHTPTLWWPYNPYRPYGW